MRTSMCCIEKSWVKAREHWKGGALCGIMDCRQSGKGEQVIVRVLYASYCRSQVASSQLARWLRDQKGRD